MASCLSGNNRESPPYRFLSLVLNTFGRDMSDNPWQLAASVKKPTRTPAQSVPQASQAGANAPQEQKPDNADPGTAGPAVGSVPATTNGESNGDAAAEDDARLVFHFAPDMKPLILPEAETLLEGTDS
jgi:hypothetical protein